MSKSLAEMRQSPATGLPRRSYQLCLATGLLAEMKSLVEELESIPPRTSADDETPGPPKRLMDANTARTQEIRARMAELSDEMADHTGELVLQGVEDGVWRLWANANPGRKEGESGHERDAYFASGFCNIDALKATLEKYAFSWNGDPLGPGDWDFIKANAGGGDLTECARLVVTMQEMAVDLPKLRSAWLNALGTSSG